jgi:hypothetical protein
MALYNFQYYLLPSLRMQNYLAIKIKKTLYKSNTKINKYLFLVTFGQPKDKKENFIFF